MYRYPLRLVLVFHLISLFGNPSNAYTWPSPQYDAVETLLYEGKRSDGSSLSSLVAPCRTRTGVGSSVPAEWLRFAFHDMATHDVDTGVGGVDGSIVYELDRAENFGLGFNDTRDDFQEFPNKEISRADVIAIGAILAVNTCGGPIIPFRAGRIDVWEAQSSTNTPQPQFPIQTLQESFRQMGFSPTEMITLTACGHTIGGVRSSDFPQLVPPNSNSSEPVIDDFDTTTAFDNVIVTQYLSGTTQNVLVVTSNATMASDLHVFSSDGNTTMKSLADSNTFMSQCQALFTRMVDTVASNVTLSSEVTLLPAKVNSAQLTFENSQLVFKAEFRLTQLINQTVPANRVVTMYWCSAYGTDHNCTNQAYSALPATNTTDDSSTISPIAVSLGYTFVHYQFVVPIASSESISKFWFEVDDKNGKGVTAYKNGGSGYVVDQDQVLFVPMLSHSAFVAASSSSVSTRSLRNLHRRGGGPLGPAVAQDKVYSVVVAVKSSFAPSRVYIDATDITSPNFTIPFYATVDLALNSSSYPSMSGYDFYYGGVTSPGVQMTIDVYAVSGGQTVTQNFMQTLLLDNTPLLTPMNVTTVKGKSLASNAMRGSVVEVLLLGLVFGVWTLLA